MIEAIFRAEAQSVLPVNTKDHTTKRTRQHRVWLNDRFEAALLPAPGVSAF